MVTRSGFTLKLTTVGDVFNGRIYAHHINILYSSAIPGQLIQLTDANGGSPVDYRVTDSAGTEDMVHATNRVTMLFNGLKVVSCALTPGTWEVIAYLI